MSAQSRPLPGGWVLTTIGDVADVALGKMLDSKRVQVGVMTPYLRNINVRWGSIDLSDIKEMGIRPEEQARFTVHVGDLLVCEGGEPGRCAVVTQPADGLAYQKALHRIRPLEAVEAQYLAAVLEAAASNGTLANYLTGSTIKHLTREKLVQVPVPLPPHDEQQRIANALDATLALHGRFVDGLAGVTQRLAALEAAACSSVWAGAGSSPLRSISEVADVGGGLQKSPARRAVEGEETNFLRVANVFRLRLDLTDVHTIPVSHKERNRVLLQPGDLLVVEGNGSIGELGRAALWRSDEGDWTHQNHLIRVRPGDQVDADFLELIWASPQVRAQIKAVGASTSGLHTLSTKKVADITIPVPDMETQRRLAREAQVLLASADTLSAQAQTIRRLADGLERSLLTAATEGRLVPQDPNDEPADRQLKRSAAKREAQAAAAAPARTVRKRAAAAAKSSKEMPA